MSKVFSKLLKNKRWSRGDITLFLERLELYISAGLTLDQTLIAIEDGSQKSRISSIQNVRKAIENGSSFSGALSSGLNFDNTVVSIIKHGEQTGTLVQALNSARLLLERQDDLIKKCLSALAYPIVIGLCAGILTIGLLRGIMPQIIPTLRSLNVELPLLTKVVIAISDEIAKRGIWYLAVVILSIFIYKYVYKNNFVFKKLIQNIFLRIPIIGKLFLSYYLSVALRSMGTLLDTGVSLPVSYKAAFENISLIPLRIVTISHLSSIENGEAVAIVFKQKNFPKYISPLISAGERTGTLGLSMLRSAFILDRDIEHSLKRITALIEPLMMVVMGCIIGAIALSIMLPIYDVSKILQK